MGLLDDISGAMQGLVGAVGGRLSSLAEGATPTANDMRDMLVKAGFVDPTLAEPTDEKPRAMFHDPYAIADWGGWRERPSALTYETLRQLSMRAPVVSSIINLRTHQVAQFAMPQQGRYDRGYRIILRDRRDKRKGMTEEEKKRANEIERMLETTGYLLPNEKPSQRDSFRDFVKKSVRDILTYDQWTFEKIRDRRGRISRFHALPAETIRPAVIDYEHMDAAEQLSNVSHVQVYDDSVIAEFSPDDIAFCVMNPRSDLRVNGFGLSPIELLIQLITAWLFGFEYNQRFFSQGSAIKGLINIKGAIPDRQLRAFRRMWYAQISGVSNAWRTPILNSDDIQWVNMHSANREMEYSAWMDWLTKLVCAVYGVDPVEINFQFGNTGQTNSLNQPDNEKKIVESKDKGLRPLMEHIQDGINKHIIWELDPNFEFSFVGLDAKSEDSEREARIKESSNYRTLDEVRADMDDPPLPDGMGQMINNSVWFQFYSAKQQEAQQAAMAGGIGPDGQPLPGGPPGDDGGGPPQPNMDDEEELFDPSTMSDDDEEGDDDAPAFGAGAKGPVKAAPPNPAASKGPNVRVDPKAGAEDEDEGDEEDDAAPKKKGNPFKKAATMDDVDALLKSMRVDKTTKNGRVVYDVSLYPGGKR